MRWSLQVVRIRGVPVRLHFTFLVLLLFLLLSMGADIGRPVAVIQAALVAAVVVCVVLHELGHALVARRLGLRPVAITLYPFGGVARLEDRPTAPAVELQIAAAGPCVNLVLALGLFAATFGHGLDPASGGPLLRVVVSLAWANLLIAAFNLIPVFPLDGGRMLRAVLQRRLGWARATVWTASAGQVTAFVLMWVGIFHQPWLILAGVVILPAANSELRRALVVRQLERREVNDLRGSRFRVLPADATVDDLCAAHRVDPAAVLLLVAGDDVTDAWIPDRAKELCSRITAGEGGDRRPDAAPEPPATIAPGDTVDRALETLVEEGSELAVVVDDQGRLLSVLTVAQLRRSISWRESLRRGRPASRSPEDKPR